MRRAPPAPLIFTFEGENSFVGLAEHLSEFPRMRRNIGTSEHRNSRACRTSARFGSCPARPRPAVRSPERCRA